MNRADIIAAMFSDLGSYKENIEEIIERYLEQNPDREVAWSAWFDGATGKDLDDAEFKGKPYTKWNNAEYGAAIKSLVGKKAVYMSKDVIMGFPAISIDNKLYWYESEEDRDHDYRWGSSMVVQYINNILN